MMLLVMFSGLVMWELFRLVLRDIMGVEWFSGLCMCSSVVLVDV